MNAVDHILEIAKGEEGYLEKSKSAFQADPGVLDSKTDGAGEDNYTKYARDQWAVKYFNSSKQGVAWCSVFVGWCFLKAFGKDLGLRLQCAPKSGNCGAGCNSQMNYYKDRKQFHGDGPEPGDQIFFQTSDSSEGTAGHTGIVLRRDGSRVYTVEGNTAAGAKVIPNGGAVCLKSYPLDSGRILGYGRPDWSIVSGQDASGGTDEKAGSHEEGGNVMSQATVTPLDSSTGTTVRLRSEPSTAKGEKTVIKKVPFGTTVTVVLDNGEWCKVQLAGTQTVGWMMSNYLTYECHEDDTADIDTADAELLGLLAEAVDAMDAASRQLGNIVGKITNKIGRG